MMKQHAMKIFLAGTVVMGVAGTAAGSSRLPGSRCGADAVSAGTVCIDKYEESVWRVPDPTATNTMVVNDIRLGRATRNELTSAGAVQLGTAGEDYAPCTKNGQSCANDIYAVSLASELPSAHISWFQAQEACANSSKRLPTSAEWQVGANGTPDAGPDDGTTDCNTSAAGPGLIATGTRSNCVSSRGTFDMVGNLDEWVADWVPRSTQCADWASFSDDAMCLVGASTTGEGPGALTRGGSLVSGTKAGPLAVSGGRLPSFASGLIGFRCVR
ncbi:MAG TPA: SUMF1/EgtB/PvdO family nonheme iron enzyme [Candidatus Binatia bacterium]|jgi:formylglycine-generating enzyme required for sulfatase activity